MTHSTGQNMMSQLVGEKCQGTLLVAGGVLVLYLGDIIQKMADRRPLRTKWHLWVECGWRLSDDKHVLVGCFDHWELGGENVSRLEGAVLIGLEHENMSHDLKLVFDNGMRLEVFGDATNDDLWELRGADGYRYGIYENLTPREWMASKDD